MYGLCEDFLSIVLLVISIIAPIQSRKSGEHVSGFPGVAFVFCILAGVLSPCKWLVQCLAVAAIFYYNAVRERIFVICPYLRLTAEIRNAIFSKLLSVSSRLHEIVSDLFEIKLSFCLILNLWCRRLYGGFNLLANILITLTASERIS